MLILDSPILTDDVIKKNIDSGDESFDTVRVERDNLRLELEKIKKLLTTSSKTKHLSLSTSANEDSWLDESLRSSIFEVRVQIVFLLLKIF